jgi:CubicO group peptidase (beta-lactamase class C family)
MRYFVLLLAPVLAVAAPIREPAAKPDLARVKALALSEATVAFDRYVFCGDEYPRERLQHLPVLKDVLGLGTTYSVSYFAADRSAAATGPENPGPYAASIRIRAKEGRELVRFVTLYRTAKSVPDNKRFGPGEFGEFARVMGVNVEVVKQHADRIAKSMGKRTFGEWSCDPVSARLLAGMFLSKPATGPVHSWNDAGAVERQWWLDLKHNRIFRGEVPAGNPFVCPRPREGKPAPEVRTGSEERAGVKKGTAENIDTVLQAFAKDTDQAFAVCIVRKGVIVLHKAYGTRDGNPMTVDTSSWMASITKTMAATLMLELIDQGRVGLDDPIDLYLPAFRGIRVAKPLTTHHLFTHTNGLALDRWPGWSDDLHDLPEHVSAYYDRLRVGQEWAYGGTGNMLGGKIFEMVTGTALPQAYRKHLFGPLGCSATEVADSHAFAHSIPLDMAKFGQMLLNRGSYGKWQFLRPETFEKMLPGKLDKLLGQGAKRQFGFGLDGSPTRFGHGAASAATFHVDTERELVVIMTRNKYGKNQDKYNGMFWQAIDEGIGKP